MSFLFSFSVSDFLAKCSQGGASCSQVSYLRIFGHNIGSQKHLSTAYPERYGLRPRIRLPNDISVPKREMLEPGSRILALLFGYSIPKWDIEFDIHCDAMPPTTHQALQSAVCRARYLG
jgi:hypothetical protein